MHSSLPYSTTVDSKTNEWSFVPAFLSGTSGIFIGLFIANTLGWL